MSVREASEAGPLTTNSRRWWQNAVFPGTCQSTKIRNTCRKALERGRFKRHGEKVTEKDRFTRHLPDGSRGNAASVIGISDASGCIAVSGEVEASRRTCAGGRMRPSRKVRKCPHTLSV